MSSVIKSGGHIVSGNQDIATATDGQWLVEQLRESMEWSVRHIVRMAAIVRRLEELGIEITIDLAALPYLRLIAYGSLSPELFIALDGNMSLLRKAAELPAPDQERIARNEPIKVMELRDDGRAPTFRMIPPLSLSAKQVSQVFGHRRLRDDAEQVTYLRERQPQQLTAASQSLIDEPAHKISAKRKGVVVTRPTFLSAIEIEHYYHALCKKSKPKREKQAA